MSTSFLRSNVIDSSKLLIAKTMGIGPLELNSRSLCRPVGSVETRHHCFVVQKTVWIELLALRPVVFPMIVDLFEVPVTKVCIYAMCPTPIVDAMHGPLRIFWTPAGHDRPFGRAFSSEHWNNTESPLWRRSQVVVEGSVAYWLFVAPELCLAFTRRFLRTRRRGCSLTTGRRSEAHRIFRMWRPPIG
jgi:hypothetical protein